MKALIYIDKKYLKNKQLSLLQQDTVMLKICGKSLIEYYFDFLYTLGVTKIYVANQELSDIISESDFVKNSTIKIEYLQGYSLENCYTLNYDLFEQDELLIIKNIGFIFSNIIGDSIQEQNNFAVKNNDFMIYFITNHFINIEFNKLEKKNFINIKSLDNIKDYIYISNSLVKNIDIYDSIPGYSKEKDIIIGKNVKIEVNCKLIAPLIILDNVKICKGSTLGPNSIIGQDSFIEENSKIINSIVYDNTFVGKNLKIDNKIVSSNYLIDKNNINIYNVDNRFLSQSNSNFFTIFTQSILFINQFFDSIKYELFNINKRAVSYYNL